MKLIRFGNRGHEKPGIWLPDGTRRDASAVARDWDEAFFAAGGLDQLSLWAGTEALGAPVVDRDVRLGSPVARPSKIVCVGLNYRDHAAESGATVPSEPVLFMKASTALNGPHDDVVMPRGSVKTDWEVELAVVIGRRASYIEQSAAADCIAGYTIMNDVSEREFQIERGGQWVKGKSCDTFAPLGPWLATPDEIADPQNLGLWLKVNDHSMQNSSTAEMIFPVSKLISYISRFMTLLPGDIVSTGTPAGVGLGFKPPRYLKAGDVIELGVEGLGQQRQSVVA